MTGLRGKTQFITSASRGIGLSIALRDKRGERTPWWPRSRRSCVSAASPISNTTRFEHDVVEPGRPLSPGSFLR